MTNKVSWVTKPFQDNTSVVKKSAAIKVSQWLCRNWRQLVDLPRSGAGSNPLRKRMLSTVESLNLNPRLSKAPTMLLLPQVGFSWSSLTTSFSSVASTGGRPRGLVLGKVHFLATRTRNQRRVSGVTRVANFPRRRRPTSLALRASRMRWASVKGLGLPPSCSRRMRFSSWRYSMTAYWCRLIQPATAMSRNWSCVVTAWRISQRSLCSQSSISPRLSFLAVQAHPCITIKRKRTAATSLSPSQNSLVTSQRRHGASVSQKLERFCQWSQVKIHSNSDDPQNHLLSRGDDDIQDPRAGQKWR